MSIAVRPTTKGSPFFANTPDPRDVVRKATDVNTLVEHSASTNINVLVGILTNPHVTLELVNSILERQPSLLGNYLRSPHVDVAFVTSLILNDEIPIGFLEEAVCGSNGELHVFPEEVYEKVAAHAYREPWLAATLVQKMQGRPHLTEPLKVHYSWIRVH